ncbi:hypothetical protein [uncultured Bacteroides sp.]|uniref:hypothetical protein n=1 Tax=uncultured Bacteroides sp. TaxID=162156 RepID=UPI00260CEF82|nr:hypothetical protein [uncultured Bacteroides sp.]
MKLNEASRPSYSKVYSSMKRIGRYSFSELQRLTELTNTDLCLALIHLIAENKVEQNVNENGVFYTLVKE